MHAMQCNTWGECHAMHVGWGGAGWGGVGWGGGWVGWGGWGGVGWVGGVGRGVGGVGGVGTGGWGGVGWGGVGGVGWGGVGWVGGWVGAVGGWVGGVGRGWVGVGVGWWWVSPNDASELEHGEDRKQDVQPDVLDNPADRHLRDGSQRNTAVVRPPIIRSEISPPARSSMIFGSVSEMGVENEAGAERDHDKQAEDRSRRSWRKRDVGRRASRGAMSRLIRYEAQIGKARRDAHNARHQKRATPRERSGQHRGDGGGERNAEIATNAVERKRAATLGGIFSTLSAVTDRMIDRREDAERE